MIRRLITTADRDRPVLAVTVSLAPTTGLRRGELCGLRWSDTDLPRSSLTVRRAVKHADGKGWVVGDPKSHQTRTMALDPFTVEVLRTHRANVERYAADARVALVDDRYLLTPDPTGATHLSPHTLSHDFSRLTRQVGVQVGLHQLRHAVATNLIAGGVDIRTVAGRLGHGGATTFKVYAHVLANRDHHAAALLGALMQPNGDGTGASSAV